MKKLTHEPFVHFIILGVLLFIGHSFWAKNASEAARTIIVSEAEMERQALIFAGEQRRVPSDDDLQALLYAYVEEEALVREAELRGLGGDDTIIRRRLAQKMRFLIEDVEPPKLPSEAVLKEWFEARKADFALPARTNFTHIYFSPDGGAPLERASAALMGLNAEDDGKSLGDPFIMKREYKDVTDVDMTRLFGPEFTVQLAGLEAGGGWRGPVTSAFGAHLVKVSARSEFSTAEFENVRERAAEKWLDETQRAENAQRLKDLVMKYKVKVAGE